MIEEGNENLNQGNILLAPRTEAEEERVKDERGEVERKKDERRKAEGNGKGTGLRGKDRSRQRVKKRKGAVD